MARIRDINDIDEGQIVDYSGDSDDGNKSEEDNQRRFSDVVLLPYSILREAHLMLLEKLPELFPEMVEGVQWRWFEECIGLLGQHLGS